MVVRPHEVNKHQALKKAKYMWASATKGCQVLTRISCASIHPAIVKKIYKNFFLEMTLVEEVVCLCHIISRGRCIKKIIVMV